MTPAYHKINFYLKASLQLLEIYCSGPTHKFDRCWTPQCAQYLDLRWDSLAMYIVSTQAHNTVIQVLLSDFIKTKALRLSDWLRMTQLTGDRAGICIQVYPSLGRHYICHVVSTIRQNRNKARQSWRTIQKSTGQKDSPSPERRLVTNSIQGAHFFKILDCPSSQPLTLLFRSVSLQNTIIGRQREFGKCGLMVSDTSLTRWVLTRESLYHLPIPHRF